MIKIAISEAQKKAVQKYMKEKLKRIPLDVPIQKYDEIKEKANSLNIGVNTYIKKLIDEDLNSK
ncbi:hypothetical protein RBG61_01475 [Paludicola sp. MB14-C6]|uniref:hypothetical protein n=1 Tax=Paludihabitans sp. MB14-C6 TaxID=3070656 RepID=UPI0027DAF4B6|nr:hypothetical protein [Paludicola sp. MB14-C6]WMJ23360.1 hypothetical protein RBG61_01475 [Paludicola sp. MB14-C6]